MFLDLLYSSSSLDTLADAREGFFPPFKNLAVRAGTRTTNRDEATISGVIFAIEA